MEKIHKKDIIKELEEMVKKLETDNLQPNNLREANDFYNEMIEKGIIKKRGFTLRGIEDTHLFNIRSQS